MEEISTIRAAGVDFHAQQRGARPRSVFLHGFAGDLHTWDLLWSQLGSAGAALRYDLRGYGQTACESDLPYCHADDLLAILDTLELDAVDLVGVSMGGSIALNFAIDHPERVRSLVLISPSLVAWEWSEGWQKLWQPVVELARLGRMDEARHLWWQHPLFATTRDCAAGPALFESFMRFSGSQWISDSHRPMLPDVERLHTLKPRALLITGARDLEDFRLIAELIEASVSDLVRTELPDSGHLLHLENPAECAGHIARFLGLKA